MSGTLVCFPLTRTRFPITILYTRNGMRPMNDIRYPIGRFAAPVPVAQKHVNDAILAIESLPSAIGNCVRQLTDSQLDTPYRPDGWTVRQVVHHVADSHMNALLRVKSALTEDRPPVKTYNEKRWAMLPDYAGPVGPSLAFLEALHSRWVVLLRALRWEQLQREFNHPELGGVRIAHATCMYAWHGRHHVAHIEGVVRLEGST